jgi:tetratricopeptide (TPR) repeat protein
VMEASDTDSDCDLAFATLDLTGVDFTDENAVESEDDDFALQIEGKFLRGEKLPSGEDDFESKDRGKQAQFLSEMIKSLENGDYVQILKGETSEWLLSSSNEKPEGANIWNQIRKNLSGVDSISSLIEAEFFAIAALNVFLQLNYTGPLFEDPSALDGVNPHPILATCIKSSPQATDAEIEISYHNAVLTELSVDGFWPCQISKVPYLLLLARCILLTLSDPERKCWTNEHENNAKLSSNFCNIASNLLAAPIWCARAAVAHERLLLSREPTTTLWEELESTFSKCISLVEDSGRQLRATLFLEYGLACYHFEKERKGKGLFKKAMKTYGLSVEVSGAMGKRTKFQTKATAQMVVKTVSGGHSEDFFVQEKEKKEDKVKSQMVDHSDDTILLGRVKFDKEEDNEIDDLTVLDQAIILALCLDVKNSNPADGSTAEEMSAYIARVLCHHDDWTVYSTALLERAWLEFEGNHTKERAILQLQALADQHTNRLTITQSTRKSIEESSSVQDRLRNVHSIVYPPRWHMLRDVAERYAELGIVTSAAEIFTEIEYWDEVVDCYRRAGKEKRAEEIVRDRLSIAESPRMWVALGDICDDLSHYEKAIALSNGRFCQAYVSLGENLFKRGQLRLAYENYHHALKLRPLLPNVWFRVGTISMQLGEWEVALRAFSEVVQQQPDESEGWANVAAVHQHENRPAEAYPALVEVSTRSWIRVLVGKQGSSPLSFS